MDERSSFVSRVVLAAKGTNSMRVTIPQVVASTLGLRPGDELLWFIDGPTGGVRVSRGEPAPTSPEPSGEMPTESPVDDRGERMSPPGTAHGPTPSGTPGRALESEETG